MIPLGVLGAATPRSSGGGSDPYFADVSALLPMTGADGSTTFTDIIGNVWTPAGAAQIDTAIKPFGTGSMLLNGNGYIQTGDSSRFGFGSGLYTMECMIYGTSPSSAVGNVFDTRTPGGEVGIALFFGGGDYGQPLNTVGVSNNSAVLANAGANVVLANTWYHLALVRDTGNMLRVYLNGVQVIAVSDSRTYASSSTCYIGADAFGTVLQRFYGSITQARITKGVCRYPSGASFTPPSAPFPTS